MAKVASPPSRRQQTARGTRRSRHLLLVGAAAVAVLGVAIGVWAIALRLGVRGSGQGPYQFHVTDVHSLAFEPTDANTLYFGHHEGLKVSHDAGASWGDGTLQRADAMQLAMPTADTNRRYAAGHDLFRVSTDGGRTWPDQRTNLPGLDLHTFAGSPSAPSRLYASPVGYGLYTSVDGGAQWQPVAMPPGGRSGLALAVAPDEPLHVYMGVESRVFESRDGARTWQAQPGPPHAIIQLAVSASGTLHAGTVGGLATRLPDGSWRTLPLPANAAAMALAASPAQPERVAVVDQRQRFYRSDDGGQTWVTT